ncbi:MAG: iron-sulfur cluster assembly protein IscA [Candidatus Oxydemutatoraceae bacterium WSBS_2016_MAG_OTU14]
MEGVSITDGAAEHIQRHLIERGKGLGVRLAVRTTGCSGMAYVVEYADDIEEHDLVLEEKGVKLVIDPKSMVYLSGSELDFAREGLNEGFKFTNPNEKARCGCGESFSI